VVVELGTGQVRVQAQNGWDGAVRAAVDEADREIVAA